MMGEGPRYALVCRLGGGGMGDVHLARFKGPAGFERMVVVKRLAPQLVSNPRAAQALVDEARIAATLSHTNIVQVHDVELGDGQVSIVMEFLHGRDVHQLLARIDVPIPLDQAVAIALGVLAALHHAHERVGPDGSSLEIVHRDVSPHNVIVTFDGAVKLVDFGIARATSRLGGVTEDGVAKGKPGYMAPEQLRGRAVDRRTDVWGAAVLLYEMTTGTRAFAEDDPYKVIEDDAEPPGERVLDFASDLERIILRGLARDPAARYGSAAEMQRELEVFARSRSLDVSQFGLAKLMQAAFAAELDAWRRAERDGQSLAEHLATEAGALQRTALTRRSLRSPQREAATPSPSGAPRARRRRRWLVAATLVAAVAGGVVVWGTRAGRVTEASAPPRLDPATIEPPAPLRIHATMEEATPPPVVDARAERVDRKALPIIPEPAPVPDAGMELAPAPGPAAPPAPRRTDPDAPLPR